ncbi:hypothetical protein ACX9I7_00690 [Streptomyces sp. L500]
MQTNDSQHGFAKGDAVHLASPEGEEKKLLRGRVTAFGQDWLDGAPLVMVLWAGAGRAAGYHPCELEHSRALLPDLK